jgi:hypothetical protein
MSDSDFKWVMISMIVAIVAMTAKESFESWTKNSVEIQQLRLAVQQYSASK